MEEKDREGNVKGEKEERKEGGRERGYGKQKAENITQTAVVWRNHRWYGNGQITFFDLSPVVLLHRTILFLHNGPFLIFAGI